VRRGFEQRAVFVDPAEVVALRQDLTITAEILDLRDEHLFNLFHVGGARRLSAAEARSPATLKRLLERPAGTVTFLLDESEDQAPEVWRTLRAQGVGNLYVVEGGARRWLELYAPPACALRPDGTGTARLAYATGANLPAAWPELPSSQAFRSPCEDAPEVAQPGHDAAGGHAAHGHRWPEHAFTRKVQLQARKVVKGGCG
jgi:rhodanese-related sulfurtransferase